MLSKMLRELCPLTGRKTLAKPNLAHTAADLDDDVIPWETGGGAPRQLPPSLPNTAPGKNSASMETSDMMDAVDLGDSCATHRPPIPAMGGSGRGG